MNFRELAKYAMLQFSPTMAEISDWRPACDMYVEDICFPFEVEGKKYVNFPNGIRFWLNNGDSIVYVKKLKPEDVIVKKPNAEVCCDTGEDGRASPKYYIRYTCPSCGKRILKYRADISCDQCGTFYDWGNHEPHIEEKRWVAWDG